MGRMGLYTFVWLILVLATVLEVVLISAPGTLLVMLFAVAGLAILKAVLIALYYQHLRYEPWSVSSLPLVALALLAVLIVVMVASGGGFA
jgi:cytochrome c oxidase subunit 4